MHGTSKMLALASSITSAMAAVQGFNYGSTFTTGAAKEQADFESEFKIAQALSGAPGTFNSARLYTMVVSWTLGSSVLPS
jgi:glucan endo-1,3-beta-D-glucosidase